MQLKSGEVNFIWSEEEFDWVLSEHAQQLIVLEASLTWCRPCKGFERAFQVRNCPKSAMKPPTFLLDIRRPHSQHQVLIIV